MPKPPDKQQHKVCQRDAEQQKGDDVLANAHRAGVLHVGRHIGGLRHGVCNRRRCRCLCGMGGTRRRGPATGAELCTFGDIGTTVFTKHNVTSF
ncbi:hypothetical protein SDC9_143979 [bioreactor metagenome]|uniref:Uncharacterized protein n=1 Tax=bioreactor metagenome TaxID=1076179 RepID=A0A645E4V1_9ZZZZ